MPHLIVPLAELLVVGRLRDPDEPKQGWNMVGVFTDWGVAVAACVDASEFVVRVPVNAQLRDDVDIDAFFPHEIEA
jgi:hypothetical protein